VGRTVSQQKELGILRSVDATRTRCQTISLTNTSRVNFIPVGTQTIQPAAGLVKTIACKSLAYAWVSQVSVLLLSKVEFVITLITFTVHGPMMMRDAISRSRCNSTSAIARNNLLIVACNRATSDCVPVAPWLSVSP